jgi:HAD superfamily hydrolase (TIGR01484 family)
MRYLALASDYDGTLAHDGVVDSETIAGLERLKQSGRKLILVTGRELPQLQEVFPRLDLCDRVVAENGALLYEPATRETRRLAEPPSEIFVRSLRQRGVRDVSIGQIIIATWRPFEHQVLEVIRECGLELQVIFNKDAVMVLPAGVNKMTGLAAALTDLKLSPHNVVGVGDAENDNAFLEGCAFSVAVGNALPALKEKASLVTTATHGAGVVELIDKLTHDDLSSVERARDCGSLGRLNEQRIALPCDGVRLLVSGHSGSGKSTFVIGLIEQIIARKYQVCVIDPEGDYEHVEGCRTIGDEKRPPSVRELSEMLDSDPTTSVIVNLVAVSPGERPGCFQSFLTALHGVAGRYGRPHWLVIDEVHHLFPADWQAGSLPETETLRNLIAITVHPDHTSKKLLKLLNAAAVIGRAPAELFAEFANAAELKAPEVPAGDLASGHSALWFVEKNEFLFDVQSEPSRTEHHRHKRKYAEGELEAERMFRFRGPNDSLDLPARNLQMFIDLALGVDAATWEFHRDRHDYSRWFRCSLKDSETADRIEAIENEGSLPDGQSRQRVKEVIEERYTAPS